MTEIGINDDFLYLPANYFFLQIKHKKIEGLSQN
jgi:hypothetical protein